MRVHVIDRKRSGNASMAAAGLVNPIVLRRDVLSWRASTLMPLAAGFYQRHCPSAWYPVEIVKLFAGPEEAGHWQRAMAASETASYLDRRARPDVERALLVPHGHGTVHRAAWLDVPSFLEARREHLLAEGRFTEHDVLPDDVALTAEGVRAGTLEAHWLVRCEGPFATWPGLAPVKGENLLIRIEGLRLSCGVHRGIFLLPVGDGLFRIGATFTREGLWSGPTEQARTYLLEQLQNITDRPAEVVEHNAGVRPGTRDKRPILGITGPRQAVLNGLGSRGVLLAPWCAAHLADHLFQGTALDPEVDAVRFT